MSHVDNVILTFSIGEALVEHTDQPDHWPIMDQVNAWLREQTSHGQQFGPDLGGVAGVCGGYKGLETPLFVGAFNYMPEEDIAFLRTLPWKWPDEVQYIVKRQHEDSFVIRTLDVEQ